jgi:integrase
VKLRPVPIAEPKLSPVGEAVEQQPTALIIPFEPAHAPTKKKPSRYKEVSHPKCRPLKRVTDTISQYDFWLLRYLDPLTAKPNCHVLDRCDALDEFDAIVRARKLLLDLAEGRSPKAASMTLAIFFDRVALPRAQQENSKRYCLDLAGRFNSYVRADLGNCALAKLHARQMRQLAEDYLSGVRVGARRGRIGRGTVNQVIALLKTLCRMAVDEGYLVDNPAKALRLLKLDNCRHVVYSDDEIAAILPALRAVNVRLALLFTLLLATGARIGELLSSRLNDLDLVGRTLLLRKTKSGRPMVMPLSDQACAACVELLGMTRPGNNAHLFPASRGEGHMAPPRKAFQRVLADLGISDRTFHDARRVAISVAAHAPGVGVLAASRMANHATTRITETRYVVTADASVRLAVSAIAQRLPLHLGLRAPLSLMPSLRSVVVRTSIRFITAG